MRRGVLLAAVAAAAAIAPAAPAAAEQTLVLMPGKYFEPARPQIVVGDDILFRNTDLVTHVVRVPAGPFDSGPIGRQAAWDQRFDAAGSFPFVCTLHPFMSGTAEVLNATISASPLQPVAGEPLVVAGRAPAGTPEVELLRADADGTTRQVASATPDPDGQYMITTPAVEAARYRVRTPRGDSPEIAPDVTARLSLHLTVRHQGRRLRVEAHSEPPAAGMLATLQLYDRWRYRWRTRTTHVLGTAGSASFTLPGSTRTYARVVLRRAKGERAILRSAVVRTRDGKPAGDPDLIRPDYGGSHGGGGHDGAGGGGHDGAGGGAHDGH
jgi:plastocyanin